MENCADLEKIISPVDLLTFQNEYFEKKPLLITRKDPSYFKDLLSIETISAYLERKDIRYPGIRLVKDGLEIPQADYLKNLPFGNHVFDGLVDNDSLFSHFGEGATIVFQALHRSMPVLSEFCQRLEKYFNFSLQTNIYLTPRSSQGFAPHFDNHDVFILQVSGSKKWKVYDSPVFLPTKPFNKSKWNKTDPQIEVELEQGDTLYMPRGFVHEALTTDSVSLHITLGLLTYTWIDLFRYMLEETHSIDAFRRSFNPRDNSEKSIKDNFAELSEKLVNKISFEKIKNDFATRLSKKSLTSDHNRLMDLVHLNEVSLATAVKFRHEINFNLKKDSEYISLNFYNKKIKLPLYTLPSIEYILDSPGFKIFELEGDLDDDGKLVLCRKLIKEGFLLIADNEK